MKMIKLIYAIHDSAVKAYMNPFMVKAEGEAVRAFQQAVNDQTTQMSQSPEHFKLFELGTFDERRGEYKTYEPVFVIDALALVENTTERHTLVEVVKELERAIEIIRPGYVREKNSTDNLVENIKPR